MKKLLIIFFLLGLCSRLGAQALTLDTTFKLEYQFVADKVNGIIEDSTGKFICFGIITPVGGGPHYSFRFFPNGQTDNSFLISLADYTFDIQSTSYGYYAQGSSFYRKVDYFGSSIQNDYWSNILGDVANAESMGVPVYIYPDDRVLASCSPLPCWPAQDSFMQNSFYLYRITADGHFDSTFDHTYSPNAGVETIVMDNSGKLMIAGFFTNYDGQPYPHMVRVDTSGNIDTTFKSIFTWGDPNPLYFQPDGKIIVTNYFTIQNNPDTLGLIRLNPDGSLDSTFNNNAIPNTIRMGSPGTVCPTSDGGYLFGGLLLEYDGKEIGAIIKTDINGFIDTTFDFGTGFDSTRNPNLGIPPYVTEIIHSQDDYYYAVGYFRGFNGHAVKPVVRFKGFSFGVEEKENNSSLKIYPNPAQSIITIGSDARHIDLIIYDINGRVALKDKIGSEKQINISDLLPGIYFIEARTDGNVLRKKFIKL